MRVKIVIVSSAVTRTDPCSETLCFVFILSLPCVCVAEKSVAVNLRGLHVLEQGVGSTGAGIDVSNRRRINGCGVYHVPVPIRSYRVVWRAPPTSPAAQASVSQEGGKKHDAAGYRAVSVPLIERSYREARYVLGDRGRVIAYYGAARVCYDHLASEVAAALLVINGYGARAVS